ncbi:hypothetical protein KZ483_23380 [Paenibacillus sp. sptzw28]|uniref:hypothetical protein n=1 Tax=Paenibacillus sp. sptzw28 TaxID=715179 RepID=UPI001C6EB0CB|nr:hypothetical protein [Paenibacillus sp. sptzw28]QYR20695.1 hypothetical protein KZ483_23380 [Paenibacillus sp. sptzw28]
MHAIELKPNLKTAGGEACDIMLGGRYAGSMMLVYREGDRLAGSIQLERKSLKAEDKDRIIAMLEEHILSFAHAVAAESYDILITNADFDEIMTDTGDEADAKANAEANEEEAGEAALDFQLVVADKKRNRLRFHLFNEAGELAAEAFLRTSDSDVIGHISWEFEPADEEIERVTEMIVSKYNDDLVDTFVLDHRFEGELLETVELTHEDLLDTPVENIGASGEDRFSVILVRDDVDALTYEIYEESESLPIGTATVDIQSRRLTGFIDFRDRSFVDDAGVISSLLMRELDKEKDYNGLNLSLMHRNELVDELVFENDPVH